MTTSSSDTSTYMVYEIKPAAEKYIMKQIKLKSTDCYALDDHLLLHVTRLAHSLFSKALCKVLSVCNLEYKGNLN